MIAGVVFEIFVRVDNRGSHKLDGKRALAKKQFEIRAVVPLQMWRSRGSSALNQFFETKLPTQSSWHLKAVKYRNLKRCMLFTNLSKVIASFGIRFASLPFNLFGVVFG